MRASHWGILLGSDSIGRVAYVRKVSYGVLQAALPVCVWPGRTSGPDGLGPAVVWPVDQRGHGPSRGGRVLHRRGGAGAGHGTRVPDLPAEVRLQAQPQDRHRGEGGRRPDHRDARRHRVAGDARDRGGRRLHRQARERLGQEAWARPRGCPRAATDDGGHRGSGQGPARPLGCRPHDRVRRQRGQRGPGVPECRGVRTDLGPGQRLHVCG